MKISKIHKRTDRGGYPHALCSGFAWLEQLKRRWKDVTCKNCLRMKK